MLKDDILYGIQYDDAYDLFFHFGMSNESDDLNYWIDMFSGLVVHDTVINMVQRTIIPIHQHFCFTANCFAFWGLGEQAYSSQEHTFHGLIAFLTMVLKCYLITSECTCISSTYIWYWFFYAVTHLG